MNNIESQLFSHFSKTIICCTNSLIKTGKKDVQYTFICKKQATPVKREGLFPSILDIFTLNHLYIFNQNTRYIPYLHHRDMNIDKNHIFWLISPKEPLRFSYPSCNSTQPFWDDQKSVFFDILKSEKA